jgi:hypothetical protein
MKKKQGKTTALLATCFVLLATVAQAREAEPGTGPEGAAEAPAVQVEVGTVLASNKVKRVDQRLAVQGMQARLTQLFRYQSYELVSQEAQQIPMGQPSRFGLPADLELRVRAEGIVDSNQVELRVELLEKEVTMVDTALTLGQQGRVVLGGRNHQGGVLLVWVGARPSRVGELPNIPDVSPPTRADQALVPATAVQK